MELEIIKCHGSGNDFLLIDEMSNEYTFSESERSALAISLCNRKTELGADGILFVMKSDRADGRMRVFNADGSEASMCGNGLRCVARYVCELLNKDSALIETMKADLAVRKEHDIFPEIPTYLVEISPVSFQVRELPLHISQETFVNEKLPALSEEIPFTAVAVPNPHLIAIVDNETIHSTVQKELSEYVNGPNELFPDGVNVSFVKAIQPGQIYVRTFERGVGFTNACGTAMSASTLVTCLNKLNHLEEPVEVFNNGGKVRCVAHQKENSYTIDLIGNATYVYVAKIEVNVQSPSTFTCTSKNEFSKEIAQYTKLQEEVTSYLKDVL
ncbi:diaminopimelate epimerase [Robertmurraya massiliosenegalensis]|uniref:diaminopimelate epimerase n=1 Tax=Robertmurraya massiliosenegalensis TaxID=1287657 RepID=UPI0002FC34EF|nr:diaminopimelate epimerase [Robertmurraya massiliosenegalensis]